MLCRFHIPWKHRSGIIFLALQNAANQYTNQVMRSVYWTYEQSQGSPGLLLVNLFFGTAFAFGISSGVYQFVQERKLAKQRPDEFPPGPLEVALKEYMLEKFSVDFDAPAIISTSKSGAAREPNPAPAAAPAADEESTVVSPNNLADKTTRL